MPLTLRRALPLAVFASLLGCDATRAVEAPQEPVSASLRKPSALRWRVVDLGAPTVPLDFAFSPQEISSAGHVAGQGRINTVTHAISVSPTGVWTVKRPLAGDVGTFPGRINRSGVQVGISVLDRAYSDLEAVVWDAAGNPTKIPGLPRSPFESAFLINDRGYIAGETTKFDLATARPFIWHPSWPAVRPLALPASVVTAATTAMNDNGDVLGYVADAERQAPFAVVWSVSGARRDLPQLAGSDWTFPLTINDAGVIGGSALRSDGTIFAWSWTSRRGYVVYPTPSGFASFYIRSIDNQGRMYGLAANPSTGTTQTFAIVNGHASPIAAINGGTASGVVALNGIMMGQVTVNGVLRPTNWIPKR